MTGALTAAGHRFAPRLSTPGGLRVGLLGVALGALALGMAVRAAVDDEYRAIKIVCRDSAPSIVAAQHVAAGLADMEANLANELLVPPAQQEAWQKAYEARRKEATDALLSAAENITYGDAERGPIRTMLLELPRFHAWAQLARFDHGHGGTPAALDDYRSAAAIMTDQLMPAARALDAANARVLDETYRARSGTAREMRALVWLAGLVMIALLAGVQLFVARRTRRVLNAGMLAALVIAVGFLGRTLWHLGQSAELLRAAREDAFASVHALWQARAVAYEANTDESRWLLDPARRARYAGDFIARSDRILKLPPGLSAAEVSGLGRRGQLPAATSGFVADELRNITFEGELDAALKLLETRETYMKCDAKIRELEEAGQHGEAVRYCLSSAPGESNWAFDQFDAALGKVLDINDRAFADISARGFEELDGMGAFTLAACLLIPVTAFLGLRPRLREYAA